VRSKHTYNGARTLEVLHHTRGIDVHSLIFLLTQSMIFSASTGGSQLKALWR
jgi:hypothetical protein